MPNEEEVKPEEIDQGPINDFLDQELSPEPKEARKPTPVIAVQTKLLGLGYDVELTNRFDPKTSNAVARFQKEEGLEINRIIGPAVLDALGL